MGVTNFTTRAPKTMTLINNRNIQMNKPGAQTGGLSLKLGSSSTSSSGKPPMAVSLHEHALRLDQSKVPNVHYQD